MKNNTADDSFEIKQEIISLKEVEADNFNDCMSLERKSTMYVGSAADVLAEAYIYRKNSSAYGIYLNDSVIGLVIILEKPSANYYSFTDLFISDPYQGKGYGKRAMQLIIDKFKNEGLSETVEIQVHISNKTEIHICKEAGFEIAGNAEWDSNFYVMRMTL
jgi:diamine N-acetyltransferase